MAVRVIIEAVGRLVEEGVLVEAVRTLIEAVTVVLKGVRVIKRLLG